jgi:hypothetical protein
MKLLDGTNWESALNDVFRELSRREGRRTIRTVTDAERNYRAWVDEKLILICYPGLISGEPGVHGSVRPESEDRPKGAPPAIGYLFAYEFGTPINLFVRDILERVRERHDVYLFRP